MDKEKEQEAQFQHGVENTRLESSPNPLLAYVKERILEQETGKARAGKGGEVQVSTQVSRQVSR